MKKIITLLTLLACLIAPIYQASSAVPTVQAKYLAFSSVTSSSATVHWTRGDGTNRIVVVRTDNNWTATDAILGDNGPTYTDVNGNLSTAPQIGSTGSYVVDVLANPLRSTTITNLLPGTTYYVKVYDYNIDGTYWDYINSAAVNNPRSFKTTGAYTGGAVAGFTVSPWSEGGKVKWTTDATGAEGYYLSVYNNTTSSWAFQNRDIGKSSTKDYDVFGLNANQNYTFYLYPYDINGNVASSPSSWTGNTLTNPSITSAVYSPAHGSAPYYNNVGVGCQIVVTVTANNNQPGLVPVGGQTINGANVTSTFKDKRDGTYELTYTVATGHTDINDQTTNLPLSFNFQDGNSVAFASAYTPANNLSAPGVDQTKPTVTSIIRQSPTGQCTNLNAVTFRVTFSEPVAVSSVTTSDFTITGVSGTGSVGTITGVTAVSPVSGGATQYDVAVNVTGINREIRLDFTGSVNDMAYGCPNASTATYTSGQTYFVDHTDPTATITNPVNTNCYNSTTIPSAITGTAGDTWVGGAPCGLSSVKVAIWRDANNNGTFDTGDGYWTGSAWTGTSPTWFTATGTSTWTWTHSISFTDGKYYVQTQVADAAGNVATSVQTAHYFIYDNTAPTGGSVTAPVASACYKGGDVATITWNNATDANLANSVNIDYWNGTTWVNIVTGYAISGTTGSYNWTVPASVNTNSAQVRVIFSDCAGNTQTATSATFTIDNQNPTVTTTVTVSGSPCLVINNPYTITWNPAQVTDPTLNNLSHINLYYYNGTNDVLIQSNLPNSGTYTWTPTTGVCGGVAYVKLEAVDCAGNKASVNSGTFTIDNLTVNAPANSSICTVPGTTSFSASATSSCGTPTYQWQYSPNGLTWTNVTTGTPANATYTGSTSATLTVNSVSPGIAVGTYYYRCVVTSACGANVNSATAQLDVVPPPTFTVYPADPTPGIIGSPLNVTIQFTGGSPTNKSWELYRDDDGVGYNGTLVASGSGTSPVTIPVESNVTCSTYGKYYILLTDNCQTVQGAYFTVLALGPEPTQVINFSGGRTRTTISLIWTSGDGKGRLIAATQNSTTYTGTIPADGTTYTGANSNWPSAAAFGSNSRLLYNGTGSSAYITGLTASTWYTFHGFEYDYNTTCPSTSINYNTTSLPANNNPRAIKTTARETEDEGVLRTTTFGITPIWPNPVKDVVQFDLLVDKASNFQVQIVSIDGRVLFTHEYNYDNVATTVMLFMDRGKFQPGSYILRVTANGETINQPFVYMP